MKLPELSETVVLCNISVAFAKNLSGQKIVLSPKLRDSIIIIKRAQDALHSGNFAED